MTTSLLQRATVLLVLCMSTLGAAEFPDAVIDNKSPVGVGKQTAVLAGGCFWCVEVVYQQIQGVEKVVSGTPAAPPLRLTTTLSVSHLSPDRPRAANAG